MFCVGKMFSRLVASYWVSEARCALEKVLNLVNQPCWSHCLDGFLVTHGRVPKSTCFLSAQTKKVN